MRYSHLLPLRALCGLAIGFGFQLAAADAPTWGVADKGGRYFVIQDGKPLLGWQAEPLAEPKGGEKFKASAFVHPFNTPSGTCVTDIQPSDHLHHFGIWWPWKHLEVDGKMVNGWEIQKGEARTESVKTEAEAEKGAARLVTRNRIVVTKGVKGEPVPAVEEKAVLTLMKWGERGHVLDIEITQEAAKGRQVTVLPYRYSGFSWRGPMTWQAASGVMRTSEGKGREEANHTPARWVAVDGPGKDGPATVVILSAAKKLAGQEELLRVWNRKVHGGVPFVNLNPVVKEGLPLDGDHPAVSHRFYRVLAVDGKLEVEEIEAAWKEWVDGVER